MKTLKCDLCEVAVEGETFEEWMTALKPHYLEAHAEFTASKVGTPEEMKKEMERMGEIAKAEMNKINAEDHTKQPTQADINRYYGYHENFCHNIKIIEEKTGEKPPFNVPSLTKIGEFNDKAEVEGWNYLRNGCGLPQGDISKPRKPWTMGDSDKRWTLEDNEQNWDTSNKSKPKHRKRGI